jgi:hypothetical protein
MLAGVASDSTAAVVHNTAPSDMGTGIDTNMDTHTAAAGSVAATAVAIAGRNRTGARVHQEVARRDSPVHVAPSCRPIWRYRPALPGVSRWRPVSNHILSSEG